MDSWMGRRMDICACVVRTLWWTKRYNCIYDICIIYYPCVHLILCFVIHLGLHVRIFFSLLCFALILSNEDNDNSLLLFMCYYCHQHSHHHHHHCCFPHLRFFIIIIDTVVVTMTVLILQTSYNVVNITIRQWS